MKFSFSVGEKERHHITYSFNFWGLEKVLVDNTLTVARIELLSLSLIRECTFTVGREEQHDIVITKKRPLLLAGARKKIFRIYINGVFVDEYHGL